MKMSWKISVIRNHITNIVLTLNPGRESMHMMLQLIFPLSEEDVRQLTFGTYQIRQANSYIREHVDETGQYAIDVSQMESDLIHCRLQSRHSSSTLYNLWIKFTDCAVTSWYCQCKSGARTLGCCSHICSVIWYLGCYRHNCNVIETRGYETSVDDAGEYVDESEW